MHSGWGVLLQTLSVVVRLRRLLIKSQSEHQCMATAFRTSAAAIAEPIGVPHPVQASQPAWAEYVPLFPLVMSWKVPLIGAICEYTSEDSAPTLLPSIWLMQAVRPAQSGATALVPPITEALPSTYTS